MSTAALQDESLARLGVPPRAKAPGILRLAHVDLTVGDLERARAFYVGALGFVEAHAERGRLYLRAGAEFDRWSLSLTGSLERKPGLGHAAFRVQNADDLESIAQMHERLGLPVVRVSAGREPGIGEAVRVRSADGFPLEFVHNIEQVEIGDGEVCLPMRAVEAQQGVRALRLDHINIRPSSIRDSLAYWVGTLGFSISEYVERDGRVFAAWTRCTTSSHDVALMAGDARPTIHHCAYTLADASAIIAATDRLADLGEQACIDLGPGRHGLSNALYLYVRDPWGNRVELYTGDYQRDLDMQPIRWSWDAYDRRGRLWWRRDMPERFREVRPVDETWPQD